ncbi:MAG: DUF4349 domain-containing protein [Chloroflexota bacterium]
MFKRGLLFFALIIMLLAGCQAAPQSLEKAVVEEMWSGVPPSAPMESYDAAVEAGRGLAYGEQSAISVERLVIRNANLGIVVEDPAEVLSGIMAMAEEMGGFVVNSNLFQRQLRDGVQVFEANVTVRVPATKLSAALEQIKAYVENPETDVLSENVTGQDVTSEYTDLKSRLRNLEDAAEQLRAIMADARRTEDVLNVLNELRAVNEQIEILKGQIQYYEESAAMSAISVSIQAQETVAPLTIGGWKPEGVARDALQALIDAYQTIASGLIWAVIFCLPIALPVGLVLYLIIRGVLRMRNKRKASVQSAAVVQPPAAGHE